MSPKKHIKEIPAQVGATLILMIIHPIDYGLPLIKRGLKAYLKNSLGGGGSVVW